VRRIGETMNEQKPAAETVKYLTGDELKAFFSVIEKNPKKRIRARDMCLFSLVLAYGLREGEIGKILVGDLDFKAEQILIRRLKRKNFSSHYVMSGKNLKLVKAWMRERDKLKAAKFNKHLFITQQGGADEPLSPEQVYFSFKSYAKQAGITGHSPHSLRHSCAVQLLKRGFGPVDIKRRLGHSSLSSTEIYMELVGADRIEKDKAMDEALGLF